MRVVATDLPIEGLAAGRARAQQESLPAAYFVTAPAKGQPFRISM